MYTGTVHNTQVKQTRPTFERRHYKKIAEILNDVYPEAREEGAILTVEYIANRMADMFMEDNPNFNLEKWKKAIFA